MKDNLQCRVLLASYTLCRSLASSPFVPSPSLGCLDRSPVAQHTATSNFPTPSSLRSSPNSFSCLPYFTPSHLPPSHFTSSSHLQPPHLTLYPYLTPSSHPTPSTLTPSLLTPSLLTPSSHPTSSHFLSSHVPSPSQFPSPSHTPPISQLPQINSYSPDSGNTTSCRFV